MGMEVGESYMKKTLRSLCFNHGWSYGVFWRFDPQNHMLLSVEDAYFEGHFASLMNSMLLQVHMLGEGMNGEAALDGRHKWVFLVSSLQNSQFNLQFSSGMKTVAVIPVEFRGVVQFGSTAKIFETPEFVDQARKFLQDSDNFAGVNSLLSGSMIDVPRPWTNGAGSCSLFDSNFPGEMFCEPFGQVHFASPVLDAFQADDLSQWLADSTKLCITGLDLEAMLSDEMSSGLGSVPGKTVCSSQSSLTNAFDSCGEGKQFVGGANNELLPEFGMEFGCGELGDVINGVETKTNSMPINTGLSFSECISDVRGGSAPATKKGLFSELGLEHLLKDGSSSSSGAKSCVEDLCSASKKRKTEAYQTFNNQIQQSYHSLEVKSMQPTSIDGQMQDFGSLKECLTKAQGKSWIDESYITDAKSCISGVNSQSRKNEEPPKATKKRARPGESTRPRPKDRQLIADRIKDLRDLIPNGAKLSIDALLNRTIKHMLFLQNLNKHADKVKQVDEPKLIKQDNSLIQKGSSTSISSSGNGKRNATWAYEVGNSNLLCPIIVEDLDEPGQMLIEMLCEERGYFLEIADIVRGFGLTILKGVMEARNDKIWAHFIVEGNKHLTRMEIFVSLMQLLHGTNTREVVNPVCEPANTITNPAPLWGDFQQRVLALPI